MFQPLLRFAIPVIGQYDLLVVSNKQFGIKLFLVRHLVQTNGDLSFEPTPGPLGGYRASAVPFQFPKLYDSSCWDKAMKAHWKGYFQPVKCVCQPPFVHVPALVAVGSGIPGKIHFGATSIGPGTPNGWGPWHRWFEQGVKSDSYRAANFNAGLTWWMSPIKPMLLMQTGFYQSSIGFGLPYKLGSWGVSVSLAGSLVPLAWLPAGAPTQLQLQGGAAQMIVPGAGGIDYQVHDVTGEYVANQNTKKFPFPMYRMKQPSAVGTAVEVTKLLETNNDLTFLALRFGSNLDAPWKEEDVPPGASGTYFFPHGSVAQFFVEGQ